MLSISVTMSSLPFTVPTIRLTITSSFVVLFILHLFLLSIPPTQSNTPSVSIDNKVFLEDVKDEFKEKAKCFQKRKRTKEQTAKLKSLCGDSMIDNFCEHVR